MEKQTLEDLLNQYGTPIFEMGTTMNSIDIDIKVFASEDGSVAFYQHPPIEGGDITNTMATIIIELLHERTEQVSGHGLILHLKSMLRHGNGLSPDKRVEFYEGLMEKMISDLEALNKKDPG